VGKFIDSSPQLFMDFAVASSIYTSIFLKALPTYLRLLLTLCDPQTSFAFFQPCYVRIFFSLQCKILYVEHHKKLTLYVIKLGTMLPQEHMTPCYVVDQMGQTALIQNTARKMKSWKNSITSPAPFRPGKWFRLLDYVSGGTLVQLAEHQGSTEA
jgi:hypothetical protein